jgi:hypothetical protein
VWPAELQECNAWDRSDNATALGNAEEQDLMCPGMAIAKVSASTAANERSYMRYWIIALALALVACEAPALEVAPAQPELGSAASAVTVIALDMRLPDCSASLPVGTCSTTGDRCLPGTHCPPLAPNSCAYCVTNNDLLSSPVSDASDLKLF